MDQLLQTFEQPITDDNGIVYRVYLYGRSRPADTWQGWLVFERMRDDQRFATDVETTQSSAEAIVYWATGLTDAYFDGALARALRPVIMPTPGQQLASPIVDGLADADIRRRRLSELERAIVAVFTRYQTTRMQTQTLFDALPYAHADVVRALEDLEKQGGFLIRRTEQGNDFLFLTASGAEQARIVRPAEEEVLMDRQLPKIH